MGKVRVYGKHWFLFLSSSIITQQSNSLARPLPSTQSEHGTISRAKPRAKSGSLILRWFIGSTNQAGRKKKLGVPKAQHFSHSKGLVLIRRISITVKQVVNQLGDGVAFPFHD